MAFTDTNGYTNCAIVGIQKVGGYLTTLKILSLNSYPCCGIIDLSIRRTHMKTKLVKATFIMEFPEDVYGDFMLAHMDDVLEPGEKIVGFQVVDIDMAQLKAEGLDNMLFTD
jgi:hypothetical protein